MSNFSVSVLIRAIDKASGPIASIGKALRQYERPIQRVSQLTTQMGIASLGAGAAILGGFGVATKAAMDFESAMADVRKVVDFASATSFEKFRAQIIDIGREIPIAHKGLTEIAAAGGQLGIAEQDLSTFVRMVAKMSTAFEIAPDIVGTSVAKISNILDIPIQRMGAVGDAINRLGNTTAAKESEILEGMTRTSGIGKLFGLLPAQIAALNAAMISVSISPQVAATGINALLAKLKTAGAQNKSFQLGLKQMGLTAQQVEGMIAKDAQGGLLSFLRTVKSIDPNKQLKTLGLLFGLEYQDDIARLVGSLNKYEDSVRQVANAADYAGSMQKEFSARSATTANQVALLQNSLAEVGIELGSALLPVINDIIKAIRPAILGFADWARNNKEFVKGIVMTTAAIGVALAAFGGISLAVGQLAAAVAALASAWPLLVIGFKAILIAVGAISAPMAALIAALGVLAYYATVTYQQWDKNKSFFDNMWNGFVEGTNRALAGIKSLFAWGAKLPMIGGLSASIAGAMPSTTGMGKLGVGAKAASLGPRYTNGNNVAMIGSGGQNKVDINLKIDNEGRPKIASIKTKGTGNLGFAADLGRIA